MNNPSYTLASLMTEKFITAAPQAAARALASLATHEALLLMGTMKAEVIVCCLNEMHTPKAAAILRRLPMRQAAHVLSKLDITKAAEMMKEFAPAYREKMTASLKPAFAKLLAEAASYAPDSAGRAMRTDFIAFRTEASVEEILFRLKNMPRKKLPEVCFVTAKDGTLKGRIRTAELAFYAPKSSAGSVMTPDGPRVTVQEPLLAARAHWTEEDFPLPVTDKDGVLVGVLPLSALWVKPEEKGGLLRKWRLGGK